MTKEQAMSTRKKTKKRHKKSLKTVSRRSNQDTDKIAPITSFLPLILPMVDRLSGPELHSLIDYASQKLDQRHAEHLQENMKQFTIGNCVSFTHDGKTITGVLTKRNAKTLTIAGSDGRDWRVSPNLLSKTSTVKKEALLMQYIEARSTLAKTD